MTLPVDLRIGKNLRSLEYTSDPTERATQVAAKCDALGGFPTFFGAARWVISAVNSGAKTFVNTDPAGGAGAIGFDDQLIGWYVLREATGETALITDSVKSSQTITLTAWISGMANGEYIQFRMTEPGIGIHSSGCGLQPYYLEHPVYVQSTFPGVGVKRRTIDRSGYIAVPNGVPNAATRTYSDPTDALPDGWTFATASGVEIAIPGTETVEENTDPLYTQIGGSSIHFALNSGTIITPPWRLAPTYMGEMVSCRVRMLLTAWSDPGAQIIMTLGIKLADGSVHFWYEQPRRFSAEPSNSRPTDLWKPLASGTWVDIALDANDITVPSSEPTFPVRVLQADIDALAVDALGLVLMVSFDRDATGTPIEGYLDCAWISASIESPENISEFGDANTVWQGVNVATRLLGKPQTSFTADAVDLKRMDPTLDETSLDKGVVVSVSSPDLGIVNEIERISDARINDLVPGDISITIESRLKRFTKRLLEGQKSQDKRISAVVSKKPAPGTSPSGGPSSTPSIVLTYVLTADVPAIIATVSPGVLSVKFSVDPSAFPTAATVRGETADSSPPFVYDGTDNMGGAMTPGDLLYVSAFAYDNNGTESALATRLVEDPSSFIDTGVLTNFESDFVDSAGDAGVHQAENRYDFVADTVVFDATGGTNGGSAWKEPTSGGTNFQYWQYTDYRASRNVPNDLRVTFRFNLKGKTIPYQVPLVQGYPTVCVLALTTDRRLKIIIDSGSGSLPARYTVLGTSVDQVIPSTGQVHIEFRAHSVASSSPTGFAWVRVDGAVIPFTPLGGGSPVYVFDNLVFTHTTGPVNGDLKASIGFGTGSGSDYNWDPEYDDTGSVVPGYQTSGGVAGVQFDDIAVWDNQGEAQLDYVGPVIVGSTYVTTSGLNSDDGDTSKDTLVAVSDARSYAINALDSSANDIVGLYPFSWAKQTGGFPAAFRWRVTSGGSNAQKYFLLDSSYKSFMPNEIYNTNTYTSPNRANIMRWPVSVDPNTSAAWTRTNANAITLDILVDAVVTDIRISSMGVEYAYRL